MDLRLVVCLHKIDGSQIQSVRSVTRRKEGNQIRTTIQIDWNKSLSHYLSVNRRVNIRKLHFHTEFNRTELNVPLEKGKHKIRKYDLLRQNVRFGSLWAVVAVVCVAHLSSEYWFLYGRRLSSELEFYTLLCNVIRMFVFWYFRENICHIFGRLDATVREGSRDFLFECNKHSRQTENRNNNEMATQTIQQLYIFLHSLSLSLPPSLAECLCIFLPFSSSSLSLPFALSSSYVSFSVSLLLCSLKILFGSMSPLRFVSLSRSHKN